MPKTQQQSSRSGIQDIARAAEILRVLKAEPRGASLGQIATAVGLPRSTVQRIAGALQNERLVIANPNGRGLRLGPEISALSHAMRNDVIVTCHDLLTKLARDTGETADLSVMRGRGMVFLDQVSGDSHRLRTVSSVGDIFPLTKPANGTAGLALLPRPRAQELIEREWATLDVDGDIEAMFEALDTIKAERLAYDLGDHTAGIAAIGFAFADPTGEIYAISVPIPMTRLNDVKASVELALLKTALQLDRMMA